MLYCKPTLLVAAAVALVLAAAGSRAHAQTSTRTTSQFKAPPNSLEMDETGTLEGFQGNVLMFRDANKDPWYVQIVRETTVSIEGEAEPSYLRPGQTVELVGDITEEGTLSEPIGEIEVLDSKDRLTLGLFPPDEEPADAKPLRNPAAGKYRIRGKLASAKDGELVIAAGRLKLAGTLGEEAKVKLRLNDVGLAKNGDTIKLKAWFFDNGKPNAAFMRAGKALAEEVNISLSEPPSADRRSR